MFGWKMRRQTIQVSIIELEKLARELDEERINLNKEMGLKIPITKKWQVNIIKKHNTSDEWEFEK